MDIIFNAIANRIALLKQVASHLYRTTSFDAGTLVTKTKNNRIYYYRQMWSAGRRTRTYLGVADSENVLSAKQNEIRKIRINNLEHNISLLENVINDFHGISLSDVLPSLSSSFSKISTQSPRNYSLFTDLQSWAEEPYRKNPAPFPDAKIYANDGTRLRSKGECIWYNCLMEYGIPFRNEPEIIVIDEFGKESVRYPDFLIKCLDGTYIIIEHLGLLKKTSYATDFAIKLQEYLRSGFVLGDNLFLTSDEINGGTDSRVIKRTIHQILERMIENT